MEINNSPLKTPSRSQTASSSHFQLRGRTNTNSEFATARRSFQSETDVGHQFNSSPVIRRRGTGETMTLRPIAEIPQRPNWRAGAEPGLDPSRENGGRSYIPTSHTPCQITAVDFSKNEVEICELDNDSLYNFLEQERGEKSVCRWININGLSWDVIQTIGIKYKLSHLALEDLVNTKTRTKVEWYANHMFIVMTLQKLMSLESSDDESNHSSETATTESLAHKFRRAMSLSKTPETPSAAKEKGPANSNTEVASGQLHPTPYRTLQGYNGGENEERVDYMESQSLLKQEGLEVSVEQVSIFVTSNNDVISFFESSAKEIETPIMRRLLSSATIIRQSEDATMVAQGIMDAVIDLAFPVNAAFKNAIDQMELDVLTQKPDKKYANLFYILKSEMTAMKNLMSPITKMIQTLRNHRTLTLQTPRSDVQHERTSTTIVKISEMTNTYLGDVEDHCIIIEESLNQMLNSAGEISDLIFNRLNIDMNNVMKTLTIFNVWFLPMTFLTGYFGMNFDTGFSAIHHSDAYFWQIAIPVMVVVGVLVDFRDLQSFLTRKRQRRTLHRKRVIREKRKQDLQ